MQKLIETYTAALAGPAKAAYELRTAFEGLTLKEKLVIVLGDKDCIFDDVLHYDSDYTGGPGNVSLYDDFYWDRRETKELSEIIEYTLESLDGLTGDETPEELAEILIADKGCRSLTLRDMVQKNIGKACHDW
jgi:hypothetical protein